MTMYKLPNNKKICIGFAVCVILSLLSVVRYFSLNLQGQQRRVQGRHNQYRGARIGPFQQSSSTASARNGDKADISEQRGYLAVLDIPEQFTAATKDLIQLYLIQLYMFNQKHLKLGMIEPYVLGSHLKTVPPVSEDFRSLPLISTFLNRSLMLNNLKRCFQSDHVELHPFPDFLINAARQFIVVRFIRTKTTILGGKIVSCNYNMKLVEHLLNYHLGIVRDRAISKHGAKYTFRGVHSLCVKAVPGESLSMKDVAHFIRTWMTNTFIENREPFFPRFSVVIPEWRAVKNIENQHYYYDPSYTRLNTTGSCQLRSLPHTSYVTQAAKSMFQHLSLSRPFLAVHVRSERIA